MGIIGAAGKYIVASMEGRWYSGDSILFHHVPRLHKQFQREERREMCFFSLILKPGQKVEFEMTLNLQSFKNAAM